MYGIQTTIPPSSLAVSLDAVKEHLRRTGHTADDEHLRDVVIPAATARVQSDTGQQLITATKRLTRDRFPRGRVPLFLPHPPLQTVEAVNYVDTSGDGQVFAAENYTVCVTHGSITPLVDKAWPDEYDRPGAVWIDFVCGHGDSAADVPDEIRHLLLEHCRRIYERRDESEPFVLAALTQRAVTGDEWADYGSNT